MFLPYTDSLFPVFHVVHEELRHPCLGRILPHEQQQPERQYRVISLGHWLREHRGGGSGQQPALPGQLVLGPALLVTHGVSTPDTGHVPLTRAQTRQAQGRTLVTRTDDQGLRLPEDDLPRPDVPGGHHAPAHLLGPLHAEGEAGAGLGVQVQVPVGGAAPSHLAPGALLQLRRGEAADKTSLTELRGQHRGYNKIKGEKSLRQ